MKRGFGEERALSDVSNAAVQLDHTFETDAAPTVRGSSVFECVDVFLNGVQGNLVSCRSFC